MLITPGTSTNLTLVAEYRGEAVTLNEIPDWTNASPANWLNWLVYRQMPVLNQDIILWVRTDLMLDSQDQP
jgi:hypothetical protein